MYARATSSLEEAIGWLASGSYHESGRDMRPDKGAALEDIFAVEKARALYLDAKDREEGRNGVAREHFGRIHSALFPTWSAGYGRSCVMATDFGPSVAARYRVTVAARVDAYNYDAPNVLSADARASVRNRAVNAFGPQFVDDIDEAARVSEVLRTHRAELALR